MDDPKSHRLPDDDLSFLGDLDRGLDGEPVVESPNVARPLVAADRATPNRRPLLDLFPPPASARIGPRPVPRSQPPSSSAGPATSLAVDRLSAYETFYGLREKPFSRESDSRFLFHSAAHDRAARELFDSIVRRDRFAVLTGDAGTGKTMLCRILLGRADRRTITSFVADPFVTLEDLLRAILLDFGVISPADIGAPRLADATRQELRSTLHEFLLSLAQIEGFAVVFIDDAQTLSPDMLAEAQGLADTDQVLMSIVLIGEAALLLKLGPLKLTSGAGRAPVLARLDALAEDEVPGYILHRLRVSGGPGRVHLELTDGALARVYEISRGVPQVVNLLCDRALTRGFEASVTLIDAPLVELAARDLDLVAASRGTMPKALRAVALVVVMLLVAAAGAFVFRAQLSRAIADWAAPPAPPSGPALETAAPFETRPPPPDEPPIPRGGR